MSSLINVTERGTRLAWGLAETASLIGVSERFLRNEIKRGKLVVIKKGKRVLVPASSLADYLKV